VERDKYDLDGDPFGDPATGRLPIRYFAALLAAGNEEPVKAAYRKLLAVRLHRRSETVGDVAPEVLERALATAGSCMGEAEDIYRLTTLAGFRERHVVPPFMREMAIEAAADPQKRKGETGTGFSRPPKRGW